MARRRSVSLYGLVSSLGGVTLGLIEYVGGLSLLFRETLDYAVRGPFRGAGVGRPAFWSQAVRAGPRALPVVFLVNFFIGMILALIGGSVLDKLGMTQFVGDLLGVGIVLELGPLLTGIIMTGYIGAALTAEIATMVVSEEITALRTMSVNPVRFIVAPRLLAVVLMVPCVTMLGDAVGIFGGSLVGTGVVNLSQNEFYERAWDALDVEDVWHGLLKSGVFGVVIGTIGCYQGFCVKGGAEGVGKVTTNAVVRSIVAIIIADALLNYILLFLYYEGTAGCMYTKHAEFKAGAVVLAGLAVLGALLYFAGGAEPIWGDFRYVNVRFEQGDVAPKKGDAVYMNGAQVGRVAAVTQDEELRGTGQALSLTPQDRRRLKLTPDEDGLVRELYLIARLKLPAAQVLPVGTEARISKSLTGSRMLSLLPGITRENLRDEDTLATPIHGSEAPGLGDIAQKVNSLVDTIAGVVGQGGDVMVEARALLQLLNEKVAAVNTEELDRDLRASVAALRRTLEGAESKIANIATNIEEASADVKLVASKGVGTIDDVRADLREVLDGVKEVVRKLDEIVVDAKAPIDSFLRDMAATGKNLKALTEEFSGLGPQASQVLAELGVDTKLLLGNLNDTAHNLLDASEDLRAHPWKLLNKPEDGEIAYENLRSAALNYTRTARDVNEASSNLRSLLARPDLEQPEVKKMIADALMDFRASLSGYKAAERRWLKLFSEADQVRRAGAGKKRR